MSSILTNASAMTALSTLRGISDNLNATQNRVATGKAVSTAADNAAYWSIATTMQADVGTLEAITKGLGVGSAQADTASNGINNLVKLAQDYRSRLASAAQDGVDKLKIGTELTELKNQMETIIKASSVNGVNWLKGESAAGTANAGTSFDVISGITRGAAATNLEVISVTFKSGADTTEAIVTSITSAITLGAATTKGDIDTALGAVDAGLKKITELGSIFGAASTRIKLQSEFTKTLSDSLSRGIGSLVDADLDSESVKLKALQTQQQLAVQALSIANSNTQTILSLFRN